MDFFGNARWIHRTLRNSVGAITDNSLGAELMLRMYKECLDVADASGHKVSNKAEKKALGILMEPGSDFTASCLGPSTGHQLNMNIFSGNWLRRGSSLILTCL